MREIERALYAAVSSIFVGGRERTVEGEGEEKKEEVGSLEWPGF